MPARDAGSTSSHGIPTGLSMAPPCGQTGCLALRFVSPSLASSIAKITFTAALWSVALGPGVSQAGLIEGVNHTHWAINQFAVDGRSAIDILGPYQGGGGGCCFIAPDRWVPGLMVRVDWETGSAYSDDFPGFADWKKYMDWKGRVNALKRQHSALVSIPDYTGHPVCGITVHFLPCDELQATTSCWSYGNPEYPIKTPLHLPEPQSCPQS